MIHLIAFFRLSHKLHYMGGLAKVPSELIIWSTLMRRFRSDTPGY